MARSERQTWGSKLGVVLAVAGSAVGLGNFLRFPAKATLNGGGSFMIPYFVALFLLGIPLMWCEWALGRYGGRMGHGTTPGAFYAIVRRPYAKYLGTIGLLGPFLILIYYTYIESWTLAYAWYSFTGELLKDPSQESLRAFLSAHQAIGAGSVGEYLRPYFWFLITFVLNFFIIYRGLRGGIEQINKVAMPLLVILGCFLVARVLTLGTPDPAHPELSIVNALGFVWNPDLQALANSRVWLEAAGQIFFTLSVGMGVITTYASYLRKKDDIVLSGLVASSTNEVCEVILGGSIAIPAAFVFFGAAGAVAIAQGGIFNIGFVSMPLVFSKVPAGSLFCGLWFLLLFFAGITSSISMIQPFMSFLEEELEVGRRRAVALLGVVTFLAVQPCIFFLDKGFVDELDFWAGTVLLVFFALVEVIFFVWIFGLDRAWQEMHHGASMQVPRWFRFILKYVTPAYLLVLLVTWLWQQLPGVILMQGVPAENRPYIWGARILIVVLAALTCLLALRIKPRFLTVGKK